MEFELFLFTVDPKRAAEALSAGVHGIIIDCENRGKPERQLGADTQINYHTPSDLRRLRRSVTGRLLVRINGYGEQTSAEVETAIEGGADEILLPMVRSVQEVEKVIELAGGRCRLGILVETVEAVNAAAELGRLPLDRVYVGLNDLMISRRSSNLFEALVDGTVESIRSHFQMPFGMAGLTLPDRGSPIPCRLIIGELARLDCTFSFLRRSFWADIQGRSMACEVPRILAGVAEARRRGPSQVRRDRSAFILAVENCLALAL